MATSALAGAAVRPRRAFYTLADASYFLGLVALINSLRLVGHREPLYVLDCGLTAAQRELIEPEATLVAKPPGLHPSVARARPALLHPAETMVLLDSDVIATRPLTALFERAATGVIVTFADSVPHRFDPRWPMLLGLPEQHRHTYANGGLVAVPEASTALLEEIDRLSAGLDPGVSIFAGGPSEGPFYYLDQDVINAILGARLPRSGYVVEEHRLAPHPPFAGLRVLDATSLRCAYGDGLRPYVLHHILRKPWLAHVRSNAYSRLLTRLLTGPDLPVRPPAEWIPVRLRPGVAGAAARADSAVRSRIAAQRGRLGVRRRLEDARRRPPATTMRPTIAPPRVAPEGED